MQSLLLENRCKKTVNSLYIPLYVVHVMQQKWTITHKRKISNKTALYIKCIYMQCV